MAVTSLLIARRQKLSRFGAWRTCWPNLRLGNSARNAQTQATTGSLCWGQTFSYDIWANLHTIGAVSGYGSCTQQLLGIGAGGINIYNRISGWSYDAVGNLLLQPLQPRRTG